jgi:outer membrane protein assembly factor BamA
MAVLPQLGYSPEKSALIGLKLSAHDVPPAHLGIDVDGFYALQGQKKVELTIVEPGNLTRYLMWILQARFETDPTKEFFGLGNNDAGPEELSTHEQQQITGLLTVGGRPIERLTLAATIGINDIDIQRGEREESIPRTPERFPDLTGIHGGETNPISLSATFNNRTDPARPTRGWILMGKVQHVNETFGNDFEFTRYVLDLSYLFPLVTRRQVIGLHAGGQILQAGRRDVPFYELASLGSSRDLRGFFLDRFYGRSSIIMNAEYRLNVADFDFFDIWDVQIDGVLFGDGGRVFLADEQIASDEGCPAPAGGPLPAPAPACNRLPRGDDQFRFSYGFGTRIALGKALVARIDVGFSEEETGLIYLTFGQTF